MYRSDHAMHFEGDVATTKYSVPDTGRELIRSPPRPLVAKGTARADQYGSATSSSYTCSYAYAATPTQLDASPSMNNAIASSTPRLPVMSNNVLPGSQDEQSHSFDHTGQTAPPGMKPRVTATLWEDEGTLCFQVEAKGVCVARREDNHMINGTKLLNVAGMTRGRRDGIMKSEKTRHVVKIGPMHLKGVWIPFERALEFANKEKITEQLYPLFVHDIGALLYHPSNQTRVSVGSAAMAAVNRYRNATASQPPSLHHHHSMSNPIGAAGLPHPSSGRPEIDRAHTFPTPPTSGGSSIMGMGDQGSSYEWNGAEVPARSQSNLSDFGSHAHISPSYTPPMSPRLSPQQQRVATPQNPHATATEDSTSVSLDSAQRHFCHASASNAVAANESDMLSSGSKHEEHTSLETECDVGLESATRESNGSATSTCDSEELEDIVSSDMSTSDGDIDGGGAIEDQKEAILIRLMLRVHEMFASSSFTTCGENTTSPGSSVPMTRAEGRQTHQGSTRQGGPRKRGHNEDEDEHEDESQKGRKLQRVSIGKDQEPSKKLACHYYKQNPYNCKSSGACCGPGWTTVHRIKTHIYRVHAMPIHCRRCYAVFENEDLLTEHSRSATSCEVREAIPMEGFDKGQEKALKSRKPMFQAESEEEKWKIVYLILFPDTPLGELPSPYYDLHTTKDQPHIDNQSPKAPELKQYDSYMRRELPRKIRKKLQMVIEGRFGPIEEDIKSELEGIVRDAQEALARGFLGTNGAESRPAAATIGFASGENNTWPSNLSQAGPSQPRSHAEPQIDALAPYVVPPDATGPSVPGVDLLAANYQSLAASEDSAYYSMPMEDPPFEEDWLETFDNNSTWAPQFDAEDAALAGLGTGPGFEQAPETSYTGKGKGRATDDTFGNKHVDNRTSE